MQYNIKTYFKITTMNIERTQMFRSGATCGHVLRHHVTWYIFFATVKDASDGKFQANL